MEIAEQRPAPDSLPEALPAALNLFPLPHHPDAELRLPLPLQFHIRCAVAAEVRHVLVLGLGLMSAQGHPPRLFPILRRILPLHWLQRH